jgi:ATP-binding cassette, subfamily B, multidrug efflux pump
MGMMMDGGRRLLDQETSKAKNTSATIARFGQYFRPYGFYLVLVAVFIFVSAWANITSPDYIGQVVDCYVFPQPPRPGMESSCWYTEVPSEWTNNQLVAGEFDTRMAGVLNVTFIILGLYLLSAVAVGLGFYTMRLAGSNVIRDLQRALFAKIHQLSLGYYSNSEAGDVMSRVTNDMDTIAQAFAFALLNVLSGVVTVVWVIIKMLQANAGYAVLSLAILPVMMFTTYYFSNEARKAFRRARQQLGTVNADLQESIAGAREVQAFNRVEESIAQFQASNDANRAANVRAALFTSALNPTLEALGYVSLAIVVVVGGLSALGKLDWLPAVSLGMVFAFIQYSQRASQPIQQIAILWTNVQSAIAGGERIFGLLDTQVDIVDAPNAQIMPTIEGDVVFDNVSAEYVLGEKVLDGVNFKADVGQMIAIVGPTGAGKTTIINLLPRFYDVTSGSVKIDGIDVRTVTQDSLRSQIGIVLQDTFLFSDTVMNNIRYGRLDATDDEVIAAAKMAAAHDFIERLPEGYQTILGERGGGLSQGQRQLLAIARVALMNPRILILDEATSSVDSRTEKLIQLAFEKLMAGRTTFVIAHRLSTIRNANQVLLLKSGQIVERGTHKELLAEKGAYFSLYMSQFRSEDESPDAPPVEANPVASPQPAGD